MICAGALGIAHGASGTAPADMPQSMPAPPSRPAAGDLLASVSKVPTPRPINRALSRPGDENAMPADEHTCRAQLNVLGVDYDELPEIEGEGQCGIANPIRVTSLGAGIELAPDAVMNCATAENAAQLIRNVAVPAARSGFGAELTRVRHASAYVCRNRASGKKISEHAKGNALDISAFILDDGRVIDVVAYGPANKPERRFMQAVRRAACGPFKTVLGPGTDADHAEHFHFDLAERRNGSTYCR